MSTDANAAGEPHPYLGALQAGEGAQDGGGWMNVKVFNARYQFGKVYLYAWVTAVSPATFNGMLIGWGENAEYGYSTLNYQGSPTDANLMLLVDWTPPQGIRSVQATVLGDMSTPDGQKYVKQYATIYLPS